MKFFKTYQGLDRPARRDALIQFRTRLVLGDLSPPRRATHSSPHAPACAHTCSSPRPSTSQTHSCTHRSNRCRSLEGMACRLLFTGQGAAGVTGSVASSPNLKWFSDKSPKTLLAL